MLYSTSIPELKVDIQFKNYDGGRKIKATGFAVHPVSGEKFKDLKIATKIVSFNRKSAAINSIRNEFEIRYKSKYGITPADEEAMITAFKRVFDKVMIDHEKLNPGWQSESTNKAALTFFESNVLKLLVPFADNKARPFLETDREDIERQILAGIERRRRDRTVDPNTTLRKHLREADIIYSHMRDYDNRLQDITLSPQSYEESIPKKELIKALPHKEMLQFYDDLYKKVASDPIQSTQ